MLKERKNKFRFVREFLISEMLGETSLIIKKIAMRESGQPKMNLKIFRILGFKVLFDVRPEGVEPPTPSSEAKCSIH